jgi:hypothetical protein
VCDLGTTAWLELLNLAKHTNLQHVAHKQGQQHSTSTSTSIRPCITGFVVPNSTPFAGKG